MTTYCSVLDLAVPLPLVVLCAVERWFLIVGSTVAAYEQSLHLKPHCCTRPSMDGQEYFGRSMLPGS